MSNKRAIGTRYETLASEYLTRNGYIILDRNYRNGRYSEIDIIALKDKTIVFIEVKFRNSSVKGNPLESVNTNKQRRISRAAMRYIFEKGMSEYGKYRFDVIGILNDKIEHIENAFELLL